MSTTSCSFAFSFSASSDSFEDSADEASSAFASVDEDASADFWPFAVESLDCSVLSVAYLRLCSNC